MPLFVSVKSLRARFATVFSSLTFLFLASASPEDASGGMILTQDVQPAGTSSLFTAVGTFQNSNFKGYLDAAGFTRLTSNPGNNYWTNDAQHAWDVKWTNLANGGTVLFQIHRDSTFTSAVDMSFTRTLTFASGQTLLGLDIGSRLTVNPSSVNISNVQFDGGSGFVDVPTANHLQTSPPTAFYNNYHSLAGPLGDFTLRGTADFPTGFTGSGDGMRFFIDARAGAPTTVVPEPATFALAASGFIMLLGMRTFRRRTQPVKSIQSDNSFGS